MELTWENQSPSSSAFDSVRKREKKIEHIEVHRTNRLEVIGIVARGGKRGKV